MNTNANNNANVTVVLPAKTAEQLRDELNALDQQRMAVTEQLAAHDAANAAEVAKNGEASGKRNMGKAVGKIAAGVGVTGIIAVGAVYAYRIWKSTRG